MTTETAQRRLLEALADLRNTPNQDIGTAPTLLAALVLGIQAASRFAAEQGQPGIGKMYAALAALAQAVDSDQRQGELT